VAQWGFLLEFNLLGWGREGGRGRNFGQHYEVGLNVQVNSFFSLSDYTEQFLTKDFQRERRNRRVITVYVSE